jgi:hypothetical protein
MKPKTIAVWVVLCALGAAAAIVLIVVRKRIVQPRFITIQGAVIQRDAEAGREVPIAGATVTVADDVMRGTARSAASGYFSVTFRERVLRRETVHLEFRAAGFHPLEMEFETGPHADLKRLFIAELKPVGVPAVTPAGHPLVRVSNVRIRYTVNYQAETNIGAVARVFQVINQGDVPCKGSPLCSPDGLWKASRGSLALDAGTGNIFRNVRVSCIAGPCPFTQVHSGGPAGGEQRVVISAVDWSDTATFLVEAEVFDRSIASSVRESYPVIYGRDFHFTLPPTAEGPSIVAEIGGTSIIFPLGNGIYLDWGACSSRISPQSVNGTIYQCELKPGFQF